MLLLRSGHTLAAVHVDEMIGNQEVVVKNIGPQLARVSGISGATVLGTGEVVLIINPVQLAQRLDAAAEAPMVVKTAQAAAAAAAPLPRRAGPPLVMIVDDSLTVRKITGRLLTREGFAVVTAKDGLDALAAIGRAHAGCDPARHRDAAHGRIRIREDGQGEIRTCAHIPIIMITSRTAEKHRNRAKELGVDALPRQALPGRGAAAQSPRSCSRCIPHSMRLLVTKRGASFSRRFLCAAFAATHVCLNKLRDPCAQGAPSAAQGMISRRQAGGHRPEMRIQAAPR